MNTVLVNALRNKMYGENFSLVNKCLDRNLWGLTSITIYPIGINEPSGVIWSAINEDLE